MREYSWTTTGEAISVVNAYVLTLSNWIKMDALPVNHHYSRLALTNQIALQPHVINTADCSASVAEHATGWGRNEGTRRIM